MSAQFNENKENQLEKANEIDGSNNASPESGITADIEENDFSPQKNQDKSRGDLKEPPLVVKQEPPSGVALASATGVKQEPLSGGEPASGVKPEPLSGGEPEPASGVKPEPLSGGEPASGVIPEPLLGGEPASGVKPEPLSGGEPASGVKLESLLAGEPAPASGVKQEPLSVAKLEPIFESKSEVDAKQEQLLGAEREVREQTLEPNLEPQSSYVEQRQEPSPYNPEPSLEQQVTQRKRPISKENLETSPRLKERVEQEPLSVAKLEPVSSAIFESEVDAKQEQLLGAEPEPALGVKPEPYSGVKSEPTPVSKLEPAPDVQAEHMRSREQTLEPNLEPQSSDVEQRQEPSPYNPEPSLEQQVTQRKRPISKENLETSPRLKERVEPRPVQNVGMKLDPEAEKPIKQGAIVAVVALLAVAFLAAFLLHKTPNLESRSTLQIFQDKFKDLQNHFPGQSQPLWLRSEKMLRNHLNKSHPDEPATLILTAARDAERSLHCLGKGLAQTYADALNASWLVIHGPSEAKYDDSTAKLRIDTKLSSGFESTARAALLMNLETLPPGSLLILYKYCDHENAAYKNVALVFTVLLEDLSLEPDIPLPELEEKVRDFLWEQFIRSDSVRSHQEMDRDKLGGVWSRISHLVLPVFPVKSMEDGDCPFKRKGD